MTESISDKSVTDENISDSALVLFVNFAVVFTISAINISISQTITSFFVKFTMICLLYSNDIMTVVKASSLSHVCEFDLMIKL